MKERVRSTTSDILEESLTRTTVSLARTEVTALPVYFNDCILALITSSLINGRTPS